jgi:hypothetical protein
MRSLAQNGLLLATCICLFAALGCQQSKKVRMTEVNGIRFEIPAGYKQQKSANPKLAAFAYMGGGPYSALLKVSFERRPSSFAAAPLEVQKAMGIKMTGGRKLSVAGKNGGCVEYLNTKLGQAQSECWFGNDLHASFSGSPESMDDFYGFLQTAELVRKEQP